MHKRTRTILFVSLLGAVVAACGSKANDDNQPPPVVVTPRQEDQFGANFGAFFRADPNSEPGTPADADVIAVSLTTEPVAVN